MFDSDKWQEIFATIKKNKLRTFLTALGVGWGIFMLVFLLGVGKGMENGVKREFAGESVNSIWVWRGKTTLPYKGLKPGREIFFTNEDYETAQNKMNNIDFIGVRNSLWGEFTINYKNKNGSFQVYGSNYNFFKLNGEKIINGRFINDLDMDEKRKIVVIGVRVKNILFGDKDPIGEYIEIKGVHFKVVGVFTRKGGNGRLEERIYMPFTTYQATFNPQKRIHLVGIAAKEGVPAKEVEDQIRTLLSDKYKFDPKDKQAIGINNNQEEYERTMGLFTGIAAIVWFVGLGTLAAGIVGVSSIMLIIVKERTKEIGIRKAIGATPWSIISLVLQESIFITSMAGYIGLLLGVGILELIRSLIEKVEMDGGEVSYFSRPEVNISVAITATLILVIAGALAGLFPAMRAANIKPIEALRAE
ncbi:ABC transporter permease [bacterium 336/3]|nr:ABC transporter permease [bacterium 336/3]